jgi:hypothetical protein
MTVDSHWAPQEWLMYDYHICPKKKNNYNTTHAWLYSHRMECYFTNKQLKRNYILAKIYKKELKIAKEIPKNSKDKKPK